MKENRVAIEVAGGVVICVAADQDVEIIYLDYDNLRAEDLKGLREAGPTSEVPSTTDVDAVIQEYEAERAKLISKGEGRDAISPDHR